MAKKIKKTKLYKWLKENGACEPALDWLKTMSKEHSPLTLEEFYDNCPRFQWLLWIYNQFSDKLKNKAEVILEELRATEAVLTDEEICSAIRERIPYSKFVNWSLFTS